MLVYNTSPMAAGILSKPLAFDKKCGEKTADKPYGGRNFVKTTRV